ncbi:heterokaryon incompatibility protein-domain-containing protein [Clohesyomyces aquaticus]|uniref:Heterokaryon incompatibility protein-domain-containing protein n=1 Tax=Clohesyomyces aquaticus TaxID=1231657 RepID=A0A1Y2A1T6_9PLEO|nr:heterokaryon incompatibility protein-domain-containing protein [Clohesyomyces aquaticus]
MEISQMDSQSQLEPSLATPFPGYTLLDDLTLRPSFDEDGLVVNPNIQVKPHTLCARCSAIPFDELWSQKSADNITYGSSSLAQPLVSLKELTANKPHEPEPAIPCPEVTPTIYSEVIPLIEPLDLMVPDNLVDRSEMDHWSSSTPKNKILFYQSKAEFQQSILRGCHLCTLFWGREVSGEKPNGSELLFESSYIEVVGGGRVQLNLILKTITGGLTILDLNPYKNLVTPKYQVELSISNASETTWHLAKSWLAECLAYHKRCRQIQTSEILPPTRLVKIEAQATKTSTVCVVHPGHKVKYLAVSHRWGDTTTTLKLVQDNFSKLSSGINEFELPRLFRDCITVARRLDCQYLWIDSLCIIQDSAEDWAHEASRMGEVYRGSYCTIAAVSASDCHASIFAKRHPLGHLTLSANPESRDSVSIFGPDLYSAPLYERAWVMQERLLSPRTIEFTDTGLGWRCGEITICGDRTYASLEPLQRGPDRMYFSELWHGPAALSIQWSGLLSLKCNDLSVPTRARGMGWLADILSEYSRTQLTFESDRPYAIQGIISTLGQETGITFTAGVCKEFLPFSLLWRLRDCTSYDSWKLSLSKHPSWASAFERRPEFYRPSHGNCDILAECKFLPENRPLLHLMGKHLGPLHLQLLPNMREVKASWGGKSELALWKRVGPNLSFDLDFGELRLNFDFKIEESVEVNLLLLLLNRGSEDFSLAGLSLTGSSTSSRMTDRIGTFDIAIRFSHLETDHLYSDVLLNEKLKETMDLFAPKREFIVR